MALFPWLPRSLFAAEKGIPSIPPARAFAWDISRKGSTLVQEIRVTEFDAYDIILAFGDLNASDGNGKLHADKERDSSWRKLYGEYTHGQWTGPFGHFLGGSGENYFRKVDNTLVVARTTEEVVQREAMRRRGELVSRSAEPGTVIPIHLQVERIGTQRSAETVFKETIATAGDEGGRMRLKQRFLVQGLKLMPGTYRLAAKTVQDTDIPSGIGVYLAIPIRDWKTSAPKP
jgi:hypothetical protein